MTHLRLVTAVVVTLLLASCGGTDPTMTALPDATLSVDRGQLLDYASEEPATDTASAADYSVSELSTRVPLGVTVASSVDGYVRIAGQVVPTNRRVAVDFRRLVPGSEVVVEHLDAAGLPVTQRIHATPKGLPTYTVTGQTSIPGEIALTVGGQFIKNYLFLLDGKGELVFYRRSAVDQYSDFKSYVFGADKRYTYVSGNRILPIGYIEGKVTVMDEKFAVVAVVDGVLPNAAKGRPLVQSENHEFMLLGKNHYVVSGYYGHTVDGIPGAPVGVKLVSSVFQEVKDGVVLFEWESTDHPELYAESEEGNTYNTVSWSDYMHLNSIDVDLRDQNFVVSFRSLNAVFKIDRRTGQILWRYGGRVDDFALDGHRTPQGQHSARMLVDGSLIYFDNNTTCAGVLPALPRFFTPDPAAGNRTLCSQRDGNSRVVKVQLDEAAHAVSSFEEWRFPNSPEAALASGEAFQFTSYRGSVQQLANGHLFLGFGTNGRGERDVLEWNPSTAQPVFELYFDQGGNTPAQVDVGSYRAHFAPS